MIVFQGNKKLCVIKFKGARDISTINGSLAKKKKVTNAVYERGRREKMQFISRINGTYVSLGGPPGER